MANAEIWIHLETGEARHVSTFLTANWVSNELNDLNIGDNMVVEEAVTYITNTDIPKRHDIIRITRV